MKESDNSFTNYLFVLWSVHRMEEKMKLGILWEKRDKRKTKKGSTMIETLVGFMVVVLMVGMFSRIVTVSAQMLNSTMKIIERTEAFNARYYKIANYSSRTTAASSLKLSVDTNRSDLLVKPAAKSMELSSDCVLQVYKDSGLSMYSFKVPESKPVTTP